MTVPPGLGVDPEHPEGGEVMVALMDDRERREFLARLGREDVLPQRVSDTRLGTMLADLGGLALGSGPSAAGLKPLSPEAAGVALRHREAEDHHTGGDVVTPQGTFPHDRMADATVVVAEPADEPDGGFVGPPAPPGARKARPRPTGPTPVVIWVLSPGTGGVKE